MYFISIFHNEIKGNEKRLVVFRKINIVIHLKHCNILFILCFINILTIFTNDKILLSYAYKKKHHTIINLPTIISHYNKHRSLQLFYK